MKASLRAHSLWRGRRLPADPPDFLRRLRDEALAARAAGAEALEFPLELVAVDDRYAEPSLWRDAARILRAAELAATVHLPSVWVDLAALDREVWEGSLRSQERALRAVAPLAPELAAFHPANFGAQAVLATTPARELGEVLKALFERVAEAVARLRERAAALLPPSALALENLEGIPWAVFEEVLRATGIPACLDLGHALSQGDDPVACIRRLGDRLAGIHLHDARPPLPGAPKGRAHLPLGEGSLDLAAVARALSEVGFAGPVVLEVEAAEAGAAGDGVEEAELARASLALWRSAVAASGRG